jgi:outer membrane protein TolC
MIPGLPRFPVPSVAVLLLASLVPLSAHAQTPPGPGPNRPAGTTPAPSTGTSGPKATTPTPTPSAAGASQAGTTNVPTPPGAATPDLVRARPGGLTADQVAKRAALTSYTAQASEAGIRAAAANVDAAWATYLPRLQGTARYARLSEITVPEPLRGIFIPIFNQWLLQATVTIPISDYFLKLNQAYTATTRAEAAARYDLVAAKAKSASDGKVAFYNWLTAQAAQVVAEATLELQKTLVQDANNQFAVGNASKADVLQAESNVAAAELAVERTKTLVRVTERQVRIAMHAPETETFASGEDFDRDLPPFQGNFADLMREAETSRYEVKSIDANAEAARSLASAARGGRYPSLSGFGDATYANPNPRKIPSAAEWFPSWSIGAQVVWAPNDLLMANATGNNQDARADQLLAQKGVVRDGIQLEVTQAWQSVKEAEVAQDTTKRQLDSAAEAYRVARELFTHGRATATQVREAENTFTRARLESIQAKAQARTARVTLEHALGRDARDFVQ